MKSIKTRNTVRSVKVLDKSINASKRMKNGAVRTKEKAEETKEPRHVSPSDYASSNVQDTARGVTLETVHHVAQRSAPRPTGAHLPQANVLSIPNPRQKAQNNFERAKGHFQDVKHNLPGERSRVGDQAANAVQPFKSNAIRLRSEADTAFTQAKEAKTAVKDAKLALKQVKQTGRQTIREVKQDAQRNMKLIRSNTPSSGTFAGQPTNTVMPRGGVPVSNNPINAPNITQINVGRDLYGASNTALSGIKTVSEQRKIQLSKLNPLKRNTAPTKAPDIKSAAPINNSIPNISNPIKDSVVRPSYTSSAANSVTTGADKTAQSMQKSAKAAKAAKKSIKKTTETTVKTAKKSVKTAEVTAKKAVKTAKQSAKAAQKTAKTAAKAAKTAEHAARATAKVAAHTAKSTAKAVVATVKAAIAAVKGLVAIIAAGGWVAVMVIVIICLIGSLIGSIFGIFFSGEPNKDGQTINSVIAEIDAEYTATIDHIIAANAHDMLDMSGARASWKEVLSVYTVKVTTDPDNPMEVATIDDTKAAILREIFWEMNDISYTLDTVSVQSDVTGNDGLPTGETETVTTIVLRITVSHKTPEEMAAAFNFNGEQKAWLDELLLPEYYSLWNGLLYGIASIGDSSMISVAESQLGNVGGQPYWSWYGFPSRVEWCACFVSWVAEQCGYIEAEIIPRFSGCMNGARWFKDRGLWQDRSYTPRPGDIIFFDWQPDGHSDHVGIVESVADGRVNTIEGNTGDVCARRSYALGSVNIYGYGTPLYTSP